MKKLLFAGFIAALLMTGCNKSDIQTTAGGPGRISVRITDGPFDIGLVESATVTITKIEIRKSGDETGNPFIVISEIPVTVDLINLRNGITEELANIEIQPGDYDLVRLYVDETSLKMKGNAERFSLKVPSGDQTGIKVFITPLLHVEGGLTAELLLDFDLAKSFVMRGNMDQGHGFNGFIFKPCIRAANNSFAGRIEGFVGDAANDAITGAKILAINSTDTVSTSTESDGHYAIIGLPGGTYSVLATKESFDTVRVEGVVVVPANKSIRNFVLVPSIPEYTGSVIENATPSILEMSYSLPLADIVPDISAFAVVVNSVPGNVTSAAIAGNKVLLTLSAGVSKDDVATVAYTVPETNPLQTAEGAQAASLPVGSVKNNVGL
jgi:hypothetical protein